MREKLNNIDGYLTSKDVMEVLNVSKNYVSKLINEGKLNPINKYGDSSRVKHLFKTTEVSKLYLNEVNYDDLKDSDIQQLSTDGMSGKNENKPYHQLNVKIDEIFDELGMEFDDDMEENNMREMIEKILKR